MPQTVFVKQYAAGVPPGSGTAALQYWRIKPNTGDLSTGEFHELPFLVSTDYDFPAQTPGGSLAPGSETITLTPVPLGVNGSDVGHKLWIDNGVGTPEAVPITGGTAVSGAASGTVIVTVANAHSGAWTIASATAGIQEAFNLGTDSAPSHVKMPPGQHHIKGTFTMPHGSALIGPDSMAQYSYLIWDGSNTDFIKTSGNSIAIKNLHMYASAPGTSGYAINITNSGMVVLDHLYIDSFYNDIGILGTSMYVWLTNSIISKTAHANSSAKAIYINTTGNTFWITNTLVIGTAVPNQPGYGLWVSNGNAGFVQSVNFYQVGKAVYLAPPNGSTVHNWWFDNVPVDAGTNAGDSGYYFEPGAGGTVDHIWIANGWATYFADSGIKLNGATGKINQVTILGTYVAMNQYYGVQLIGPNLTNVKIQSAQVVLNGQHAGEEGIRIGGGPTHVSIGGNTRIGGGDPAVSAAETQLYGISVLAPSDHLSVIGNDLTGNLTDEFYVSTTFGTGAVVKDNLGYNPVGASSITVTASPFTYTAGASPETVYITAGTITSAVIGATTVATAAPCTINLAPNEAVVVTYPGAAPTMVKDIH